MKEKIKTQVIAKRDQYINDVRTYKSTKIKETLFSMKEYIDAKNVLIYVNFGSEVETKKLITEALKDKNVYVPYIENKSKKLRASEIKSLDELGQGSFGILEPKQEFLRLCDPGILDLAIIPGIAFDKKGNRLGYGFGYYDKFLKDVAATKIAIAFDIQVIDSVPVEPHDVPMDIIITEINIINCN